MAERVGMRPRALALAVDGSCVLLASFLFGPWLGIRLGLGQYGGLGPGAGGMMAGALGGSALIALLYFASEAVWDATPGKRLLGLCIGTDDGRTAPRSTRTLRWAVKNAAIGLSLLAVIVSMALPGLGGWFRVAANLAALITVGGCLLALAPPRQALHDRVAGTAVYARTDLLPQLDEELDEEDGEDTDAER